MYFADLLSSFNVDFTNFLKPLLDEFVEHGCSISPTFKLWYDFLVKVTVPLKLFLSSTKNGIWAVHQVSKAQLLPLLFAANRTNYARYLPVMLLLMNRLPVHVKEAFNDGSFVAKLSPGIFNEVWMDYTIEATENKSLKGSGGIIGLTLRGSALARWFYSRPITASYSAAIQQLVTQSSSSEDYHDGSKTTLSRWNTDVLRMGGMFETSFIDPFNIEEPPVNLVNFASGVIASAEIEKSMVGALEKGQTMVDKFVTERLVNQPNNDKPLKSLQNPLQRSQVKTMSEMRQKVKVRNKNISINAEIMYLRLLAVNSKKKVSLKRTMSFENAPVPLSMFKEDGTMMSCVKSQFMHKLEETVPGAKITAIESCDVVIFDPHAIIQMLGNKIVQQGETCYKTTAIKFIEYIISRCNSIGNDITEIHIIFDKYYEESIKSGTRSKRGSVKTAHSYIIKGDIQIPLNWTKFLAIAENKAELARYYTEYLMESGRLYLKAGQSIYLSGGLKEKVVKVDEHGFIYVPDLRSNQEEADTRIILHAITRNAVNIVVSSPDTDVLVLLLHHRPAISSPKIYMLTGNVGRYANLSHYIPVHDIYESLSHPQHRILLSAYCLTGCDTVSSFFGHGKKSVYRILQKPDEYMGMETLGDEAVLIQDELLAATKFIGALYGKQGCTSLNLLRCEKGSKMSGKKLPPTDNSFQLHVLRCLYQLYIWKHADTGMIEFPAVIDFGYESVDAELKPKMMSQPVAAPELLKDLVCDCKPNECHRVSCTCLSNEQPCTADCRCEAELPYSDINENDICTNPLTAEDIIEEYN